MQMPPSHLATSPEPLPRTHGLAAASLASAMLCCVPVVSAVSAIVLGVIAVGAIRDRPNEYAGRGLAMTGIALGVLVLVIQVVALVLLWLAGMNEDYISSALQATPTETLARYGGMLPGME